MDFQMLNLFFKCGKEYSHKRIKNSGLSETECLICSYAYSHDGCVQDDVVQTLHMDKTTVAKALHSLEEKGYISRVQATEDRRKKLLFLTPSGRECVSSLLHLHDNWFSSVLTCLSDEEQKQFEGYCVRLLRAAEEKLAAPDEAGS